MIKKVLTIIFAISMLISVGTAVAPPPSPVSSPVVWTGLGTTSATENCSDVNFEGAPGLHWIATGHNASNTNYVLTINVSGVEVETATPHKITGTAVHFYTDYYDFNNNNLEATLTFTGTMDGNAQLIISHYCSGVEIPEFPTVALPVVAILGLAFIFMRRKE